MLATSFAAVVSSQLFTISPSIYLFIGEASGTPLNLLARDRIFRDYTSDNLDASTALAGIPDKKSRHPYGNSTRCPE